MWTGTASDEDIEAYSDTNVFHQEVYCNLYIGRNSTLQVTRRGAAKESAAL